MTAWWQCKHARTVRVTVYAKGMLQQKGEKSPEKRDS